MKKYFYTLRRKKGGFTLVEMMIVLFMFLSLTTMLLVNYNKTSSRIALLNQAHEIALAFREAQIYALGARFQNGQPYTRYGIYLNMSNPSEMMLYVDKFDSLYNTSVKDGRYNSRAVPCGDVQSECVKIMSFAPGMYISGISSVRNIPPPPIPVSLSETHTAFTRPNPDAAIWDGTGANFEFITVNVRTRKFPTGSTIRRVTVMNSGQILVQ